MGRPSLVYPSRSRDRNRKLKRGSEAVLRKLMLLAATMIVMSLLAVTPAFAQQGTTFDVVCNIRAQGGEGMVIIVSSNEQSDVLVRLAGPFETRAEARVAAEAFGGVGATGCNENPPPPPPPPPGPGPDRDRDRDRDRDFFGVPFADVDVENEAESGPVDLEFSVTNTGDYASQCVPALQFGNTGNFNNAPTLVQGGSGGFVDERDDFFFFDERNHFGFFDDDRHERDNFFFGGGDASIDDFEPGGIEFSVSPELSVDCSHTVQQSSAASSTDYWHTSSPHWW